MKKDEVVNRKIEKIGEAYKGSIYCDSVCNYSKHFVHFLVDFLIHGKKVKRVNGKKKGSAGELELSNKLKEFGFDTRRTQQYCGNSGEAADIIGLPGVHIECKRVEALNIDLAMDQAVNDAVDANVPMVFHRKNKTPWKVTMLLEDFVEIYKRWKNVEK